MFVLLPGNHPTVDANLRASADGIAETYNAALGGCQAINRTTLEETLQGPHVYYAFFLHALLRDKNRRGEILSLPHAGNQADRLTQALYDRNVRFQGTGQPQWAHACDKCTSFFRDSENQLRASSYLISSSPC